MRFHLAITTAVLLAVAGCQKQTDTGKGDIERADRLDKAGEFAKAIQAYEGALDGTVKTAELHYKMAAIYDGKLKAPLDAIHHYDRFLDLVPSGKKADDARGARKSCEKMLQAKMNNEGFMPQSQAAKMRRDYEELLAENTYHKGVLKDKGIEFKPFPRKPTNAEQAAKDNLPQGTKEYKVKSGDTLASIAFNFYKNRGLAGHIKDANQVQLKGSDKIFVGQTLIIPDPPRR